MSFMEAFNREKKAFLPLLSSKRNEAELRKGQQQMREEWSKLISQVRGNSNSPCCMCECDWCGSLNLDQEYAHGKTERWYFICISESSIDPEPKAQTNWMVYSALEELERGCVLPFCFPNLRTVGDLQKKKKKKKGLHLIIFEPCSDQRFWPINAYKAIWRWNNGSDNVAARRSMIMFSFPGTDCDVVGSGWSVLCNEFGCVVSLCCNWGCVGLCW